LCLFFNKISDKGRKDLPGTERVREGEDEERGGVEK
jgi:hypothetical protein